MFYSAFSTAECNDKLLCHLAQFFPRQFEPAPDCSLLSVSFTALAVMLLLLLLTLNVRGEKLPKCQMLQAKQSELWEVRPLLCFLLVRLIPLVQETTNLPEQMSDF